MGKKERLRKSKSKTPTAGPIGSAKSHSSDSDMSDPGEASGVSPRPSGSVSGATTVKKKRERKGVNTSSPRVTVKLKEDGTNFAAWAQAISAASVTKGAASAVEEPLPGSDEDAAVKQFLLESVPEIWINDVANLPSAFHFMEKMREEFQSGKNDLISNRWLREMGEGIRPGETLRGFCHRILNLSTCLKKKWFHNSGSHSGSCTGQGSASRSKGRGHADHGSVDGPGQPDCCHSEGS